MVTTPHGAVCRCGVRGCWETEVGASAVAAALGRPLGSVRELAAHVRSCLGQGERAGLERIASALGRGVGTLVNLLNPRMVILGGLLRDVYDVAAPEVECGVRAVTLQACLEEVQLASAACGPDAVLVGAAENMWLQLLQDPARTLPAAS
jgi:predicted NBD/HSP70 family sugar kinase